MAAMIKTEQQANGEWKAWTESAPLMEVFGNTQPIVVGIIERFQVWYLEREVKRRHREMVQALSEVIEIDAKPIVHEDTAPSEITIYEDIPMNGDAGC